MVDNVNVGIDACQSRVANHQSPNTNCRNDIVALVKMSISNVTKGVKGWMTGYSTNGVNGNGSPVKRQLSNRSSDAGIDLFDTDIENWTSNNITRHLATAHIRSGASMLSKSSIKYKNGTTVDDFQFNSDDYGLYRVYHSYQGNGNGIVAFSLPNYGTNYGNQTLIKRYPTLDYLCQGYMAVSYCADVNSIARILDDNNDIESSVSEMYDLATEGSWTSKFFKLYTYNSDDVSESWQASMRVFYIEPNSHPYETECDTGR